MTASPIPRMPWKWTALTGVRYVSWTAANQRGRRLTRPNEKMTRVEALAPALAFARQLLRIANVTSEAHPGSAGLRWPSRSKGRRR